MIKYWKINSSWLRMKEIYKIKDKIIFYKSGEWKMMFNKCLLWKIN